MLRQPPTSVVLRLLPALALGLACTTLTCERPTAPANPNAAPHTRLGNIPKDNDTVFALATMYWDAGDDDGYITGFQYRYLTYHLTGGSWTLYDSTAWKDTVGATVTIPFNSTDALNKQVFFVRAIDNEGAADPNPAVKTLFTTRTTPPISRLLVPAKGASILVSPQITDWWNGVTITFNAKDQAPQGGIEQYAWAIDGGQWHWTRDTTVALDPSLFQPPLSGPHKIKVTSQNNTKLIDPVGDSAIVNLIVPSFTKKILLIDETDEFNLPFVTLHVTDDQTDAYYAELFPGADQWDFKAKGMPPREVLAQYQLLVWHADDVPVSKPHKISDAANIAVFTDYLRVGGKFLMSGWRILKSFAYFNNFPFAFPPGSFVYDILHIQTVDESDVTGDMIGGKGRLSFTSFSVDSAKLALSPYNGKLGWVNLITKPAGFTDGLYAYKNRDDSPYTTYRDRFIALRYYGTVYDAVVLGFPLYFVQKDDAKVMVDQILRSLHVN